MQHITALTTQEIRTALKQSTPTDALDRMYRLDATTGAVYYSDEYLSSRAGKTGPKPHRGALGYVKGGRYLAHIVPGTRKNVYLHRLVFRLHHGRWPAADLTIDHINGDKHDNRPENLREVDNATNNENRNRVNKNNTTGYTGVRRSGRKFTAMLGHKREYLYLGTFDTAQEAHERYLQAKAEYHKGWVPQAAQTGAQAA